MPNPVWVANAAHARAVREKQSPERVALAKSEVHAASLQVAIEKAIASAPPLTTEARQRLASLLLGEK